MTAVAAGIVALVSLAVALWLYWRTRAQQQTIDGLLARHRAQTTQYDDLFERTGDLMIVHDRRARVVAMNRLTEQVSGYSRDEARTIDADWMFTEKYMDTVRQMMTEGPEALPRTFRAEVITRRSAHIPIEAQAKVLVDNGALTGVSVIARNMSERDNLEAQLRQAQKMEAVGRLARYGMATSSSI